MHDLRFILIIFVNKGFCMSYSTPALKKSDKRRGRPASETPPKNAVQSLTRALHVLAHVAELRDGASLSDIAQYLSLPVSTVHRLLVTMSKMDFVHQDPHQGLWYVGVKAFTVGNAFLQTRDFVAVARPIMRKMMEQSGESANLGIIDGTDIVFLSQVECGAVMRVLSRPGGRAPLHCSSLGKAILAATPVEHIMPQLDTYSFRAFTDKTITSFVGFEDDLIRIKGRGYALDDEEYSPGLRCIAAPFFDENAEVLAAISLSGPSARIPNKRVRELGTIVIQGAHRITQLLGGRYPENFKKFLS